MNLTKWLIPLLLLLACLGVFDYINPAFLERLISPDVGTCNKCDRPWTYVVPHQTDLIGSNELVFDERGKTLLQSTIVFPLCGTCWTELGTYKNRLPYYFDLISRWGKGNNDFDQATWESIQQSLYFEEFGELQELPPVNIRE